MAKRSVQIVDFQSSHYPNLDLDAIKKIMEDGDIEKLPTLVVSIGGVARSGKSFLMNLIVHFLGHIDKVRFVFYADLGVKMCTMTNLQVNDISIL